MTVPHQVLSGSDRMEHLCVRMLGEFSLCAGENKISDRDNRSKKVWQLIAYLICHRERTVSQKKLIELLWGDDPDSSNPENALKITFHRARTMLGKLWKDAGHQLIVHRGAGYAWNGDIMMDVDVDRFESLCLTETADGERVDALLSAIELYKGDFLEKLSSETWVIPIATHYHNMYIQTVMNLAPLLSELGRNREVAEMCRAAIAVEPYYEPLYQFLIRALAATDDQKGASAAYEELSRKLFDDFGINPSDETRAVYRAATQALNSKALPMETVLEHLQEQETVDGALQCEYDYFKVLCHVEARAMQRSGKATHVALLSVSAAGDKALAKRSLNTAMEHIGEEIRTNLRRGDTFAKCSASQYIIMLPQANYENSCMVCRRIIGAFTRKYPHSPAKVNFMVQPLTPNISVPQ